MIPWHNIPLTRILIPFLLGSALAIRLEARDCFLTWLPWLLMGMILGFQMLPARTVPFRRRWIHGILIGILWFICGYEIILLKPSFQYEDHFGWQVKDFRTEEIVVCIDNEPMIRNGNIRAEASVLSINGKTCNGKISMSLGMGKSVPAYGELIRIRAIIRIPEKARNPYDFNYRKQLYYKGIYHTAYARRDEWENLGMFRGNVILWASILSRNFLIKTLRDNGLKDDELDIGSALLLGANSNFDPELRQIYGKAGVTHILSVSGLHVGLVFLVFSHLLGFIRGTRFNNLLRAALLVLLIWGYAFLTGLSPAVQRSAMMLSLVIMAREMHRKPDLLNVLSASALLLLMIDPYLLTNLGFQLSYLAVAGIVLLDRPIYELIEINNSHGDKVWKLCSVSFAAQGSTSPLSILYFHHFPLYFLPANLIIIPLSSLVMYWGLGALALSWVPVLKFYLFYILNLLVMSMTGFTTFIASLPYSYSGTLLLDTHESLLLYAALVSAIIFLHQKKFILLWICMLSIISIGTSGLLKQYRNSPENYLIAYSASKQGMLSVVHKNTMLTIYMEDSLIDPGNPPKEVNNLLLNRNIKAHSEKLLKHGGNQSTTKIPIINGNEILFGGKHYLVINDSISKLSLANAMDIKGIIAFTDPRYDLRSADLPKNLSWIVAGPGISKQGLKKWIRICNQLQIKFFDLKKRGAFVLRSG